MEDDGTNGVTICANESLADTEATVVIAGFGRETDVPGVQVESDPRCYYFSDVDMPNDGDIVRYEMDVYNDTTSGSTPVGFAVFEFREINNIVSFDCNGAQWSRIAYVKSTGQLDVIFTNTWNFNVSATGAGSESVCAPATNLVYGTDLTYCQPGDVVLLEMGTHYTNYLNYNGYYGFSLDRRSNATYTENIIFGPDGITETGSTNNQASIKNFAPSNTNYHVCTVVPTSDGMPATAAYQSGIQDLNVQGFTSGTQCFINFANEHSGGQYELNGGVSNVTTNVDCGLVALNSECYAGAACSDDVDMSLEYQGGLNEIQIPKAYLAGL